MRSIDRSRAPASVVLAALAALAAALPGGAHAEPAADHNRAGVAVSGLLPVGGWADRAGAGGGAVVWLDVPVSPELVVTARAGALIHAPVTPAVGARLSLLEVPVLGGARLAVKRIGGLRLLAGGDVGLVVAHERVSFGGVTEGDTSLRFGAALVAGLAGERFAVEVGPWLADLTELDETIGVQLTLAVRLRSW